MCACACKASTTHLRHNFFGQSSLTLLLPAFLFASILFPPLPSSSFLLFSSLPFFLSQIHSSSPFRRFSSRLYLSSSLLYQISHRCGPKPFKQHPNDRICVLLLSFNLYLTEQNVKALEHLPLFFSQAPFFHSVSRKSLLLLHLHSSTFLSTSHLYHHKNNSLVYKVAVISSILSLCLSTSSFFCTSLSLSFSISEARKDVC